MKSMQKGFTLIELMIVVAIIAILAAIAIPQYQTYVIRSQVTRVMGEAGDQKVVVEDCLNGGATAGLMASGTANSTDASCIMTATSSDLLNGGLPAVTLGDATTQSTIVATFGNHSNASLKDSTLTWTRSASGAWKCTTNVATKYTPASCPAS